MGCLKQAKSKDSEGAGQRSAVSNASDSRARGPGFTIQSGHFISPSADSGRTVASY